MTSNLTPRRIRRHGGDGDSDTHDGAGGGDVDTACFEYT